MRILNTLTEDSITQDFALVHAATLNMVFDKAAEQQRSVFRG